jgi:hypothetical protein
MEFITVPFWVEWEMKSDPQFTQIFHREQRANHVLSRLIVDQHLTNRNTGIIVRTYQFCPVLSKVSTWQIRIQEYWSDQSIMPSLVVYLQLINTKTGIIKRTNHNHRVLISSNRLEVRNYLAAIHILTRYERHCRFVETFRKSYQSLFINGHWCGTACKLSYTSSVVEP